MIDYDAIEDFLQYKTDLDFDTGGLPVHRRWRVQIIKHNRSGVFTIRKGYSGYRAAAFRYLIDDGRLADSVITTTYLKGDTFSTLDLAMIDENEALSACYEIADHYKNDSRLSLDRGSNFFFREIPEELIEIIDGALAGDGSIMPASNKSAYFAYQIGEKQRPHIEEMQETLKKFGYNGKIAVYRSRKDDKYHNVCTLTWFLWAFKKHRDRWYAADRKKRLPEDVRNTPTFWRWFYAGDGCFEQKAAFSGQVTLCVNDFSTEDVERLQAMLLEHGLVSRKWAMRNQGTLEKPQWLIWLFGQNARKFLQLTSPPVRGLEYKWAIPDIPTYVCAHCKVEFKPYRADMKYCTPKCRGRRKRAKE